MEENNFPDVSKKSKSIYIALGLMVLVFILSLNTDLLQFSQRKDTGIPNPFFIIIFAVDLLIVTSLILIYLYKKVGVILFPIAVIIHYMLHNFYLSTILYSDLNLLFVYFSAGLLVIVPRWKFFK